MRFIVRGVGAGSSGFQEITLDFSAFRWGINSQREASMDRGALLLGFILTLLAAAGGCQANRPKVASAEAPAVPVSHALQREVTDFVDFTGRTEAVHSVEIRPRVTGYLVKMPFKEGAEVKQGDLLFVVDPRPYKAQVDQAQGQVDLYQGLAQTGQDDPCP